MLISFILSFTALQGIDYALARNLNRLSSYDEETLSLLDLSFEWTIQVPPPPPLLEDEEREKGEEEEEVDSKGAKGEEDEREGKMDREFDGHGKSREVTFELIPGGSRRAVTAANRKEFLSYFIQWYCRDSVYRQLHAFALGFMRVTEVCDPSISITSWCGEICGRVCKRILE